MPKWKRYCPAEAVVSVPVVWSKPTINKCWLTSEGWRKLRQREMSKNKSRRGGGKGTQRGRGKAGNKKAARAAREASDGAMSVDEAGSDEETDTDEVERTLNLFDAEWDLNWIPEWASDCVRQCTTSALRGTSSYGQSALVCITVQGPAKAAIEKLQQNLELSAACDVRHLFFVL